MRNHKPKMIFQWMFPKEEQREYKISYLVNLGLCYYFITITSLFWALTNSFGFRHLGIVVVVAFAIDYIRQKISPELQMSMSDRKKHFIKLSEDPKYKRIYRNRFNLFTASIYWAWWMYFVSIILILQLALNSKKFFDFPPHHIVAMLSFLYPFLKNMAALQEAYATPGRVTLVVNFFSISWIFMLLALISEVSGGAFFYVDRDIKFTVRRLRRSKRIASRGFLNFCLALVSAIFCYCIVGISELLKMGVYNSGSTNAGQPIKVADFTYIIFLLGITLLGTSGCIRFMYLNLLYRISGGFKNIILESDRNIENK
jgi:hypothetical protein